MGLKSILGREKKAATAKRAPLRNESLREDPADDIKRVARRRLIGSVALLLAAIVVLPLVLEDAPKPVAPDIALSIPSRDLAVRSNPGAEPARDPSEAAVADKGAKSDKAAVPKSDGAKADSSTASNNVPANATPAPSAPVSETKRESAAAVKTEPPVVARAETKSDNKADTKADNKPSEPKPVAKPQEPKPSAEPKAGKHLPVVQGDDPIASFANVKPAAAPKSGSASATSSAPGAAAPTVNTSNANAPAQAKPNNPAATTASATATTPRSNHWVQIGAFGQEAKAREIASQLRSKGFPAVTEVVRGGSGELYRVRVGPLETKESAGRARDNLAKSGFDGSVVQ